MPAARIFSTQLRLELPAGSAGFTEAGADHDESLDPFRDAVVDRIRDQCGRHGDHRQIDRTVDIRRSTDGGKPFNGVRLRVNRHDPPGKSARDDVVKDLRPDAAAHTVRADDRNDLRLEERPHRCGRRLLRSVRGPLGESGRHFQVERDVKDAVIHLPGDRKARFAKHVDHPAVLAEHVRIERPDSRAAADLGQALEHARPNAAAPPRIRDGKRHFGPIGMRADVVPGGRDNVAGILGHQDPLPLQIDPDELLCLLAIDPGHAEESVVERLLGHPMQQVEQPSIIVGPNRPQMNGRAVPEHDVGAVVKCGDGHGHIPDREHAVGHRPKTRSAASWHQARGPVTDFRRSREAIRDPANNRWQPFRIYRNPAGTLIANSFQVSRTHFQESRTSWN